MDFAGYGAGDEDFTKEQKEYQKKHLSMLKGVGKEVLGLRKDINRKLIGGPIKIENKIYTIDIRDVKRLVSAAMSDSMKKVGYSTRGD